MGNADSNDLREDVSQGSNAKSQTQQAVRKRADADAQKSESKAVANAVKTAAKKQKALTKQEKEALAKVVHKLQLGERAVANKFIQRKNTAQSARDVFKAKAYKAKQTSIAKLKQKLTNGQKNASNELKKAWGNAKKLFNKDMRIARDKRKDADKDTTVKYRAKLKKAIAKKNEDYMPLYEDSNKVREAAAITKAHELTKIANGPHMKVYPPV